MNKKQYKLQWFHVWTTCVDLKKAWKRYPGFRAVQMFLYQATFKQWLKTENKISSRIHLSAIVEPWKDIRTSGQIFCKPSESSMPQQYAASHQASQELEVPLANLQVVNPMDSLWTSPFVEWCEISWNIWDLCFGEHNSIGVWEGMAFPFGLLLFIGMFSILTIFFPRISACFLQEIFMMKQNHIGTFHFSDVCTWNDL